MSLRLRLNLLITALLVLIMALGTLLLLRNARDQVQAEIESISTLTTHLLDAETLYFARPAGGSWPGLSRLKGLEHLRHLRIEIYDSTGELVYTNPKKTVARNGKTAPRWFTRLMTAHLEPARVRREVYSGQQRVGEVRILADPSYEIAEVWGDTVDLFTLVLVFFVAVNVMVYWAVGHALQPVDRILVALNELERGNLDARLPMFETRELTSISEKFNRMAQTLQQSIRRNHRLSQKLIQLQEEERKNLARDLHDELGQCLTAILADTTVLLRMSERQFPAALASAQAVVEVTHQMMDLIRAMLQRLRPETLDRLGLQPALDELVANWRQRNAGLSCIVRIGQDLGGMPEAVSITAYRVVQECLTNIARHAGARRVRLEVCRGSTPAGDATLEVMVEDDGRGFDPQQCEGFGLNGMRERVEGGGGRFVLVSCPGHGTRVQASLPLNKETDV